MRNGPGICGLLTVLFTGLKLTGHITWNWVWVIAPIWGPVALVFCVFIIVFVIALMNALIRELFQ